LETKYKSGDAYQRLRALEKTHDGFKLAEMDMQIRGTGEILGVRQSGETDIPISVISNMAFLEKVQSAAFWLLETYPGLVGLDELRAVLGDNL
jgi:ATP-dependent DNA helicase RecG